MRPEAPLISRAEAIFRAGAALPLATPADMQKLFMEGDGSLNILAVVGRGIADTLAQGLMPDERMPQRLFAGLAWDEAGVLTLKAAGLSNHSLLGLAKLRPLGLALEARERLLKAGIDPVTVAALESAPQAPFPPLKELGMMSMMPDSPMAQNPAFKAQFEKAMQGVKEKLNAHFKSPAFRDELWRQLLEAWRTRIQVGSDQEETLDAAQTDVVMDGASGSPLIAPPLMSAGATANAFLKSSPLTAVLDAATILDVLRAKASVAVKLVKPEDVRAFTPEQAGAFYTRKSPSDLILVRLQEAEGTCVAHFTKGAWFGRDFKPVDEPVPVDATRDGECWTIKPRATLAPGAYGFMMGGKNVVMVAFRVN
jgi:hypothetical protein